MNLASAQQHLQHFLDHADAQVLRNNLIGLEKESLRVRPDGHISDHPHPLVFGSALTHPWITTDYSEALIEMITPPLPSIAQTLKFLCDIHRFVYSGLDDESLWATSMPCILGGENSIPVAEYGNSCQGLMKRIYRIGLGHRYGRVMQIIAGVHFNFSFSESIWPVLRHLAGAGNDLNIFISERYLGLVRNLQRVGWLVPYLFGASPAVCDSFFIGRPSRNLPRFDAHTLYEPFATSLRMGDIGYTSAKEGERGIKANYDSLDSYIDSLEAAIRTPVTRYQQIGIKVNGEYRQLNDHILQIENEYYSTVRPKPIAVNGERPAVALRRRGVRYVELRSLDINAYEPAGVSLEQLQFLEVLMLFSLFADSPRIETAEMQAIDTNLLRVAHRGREPGLNLQTLQGERPLAEWAHEILRVMEPFCVLLDGGNNGKYCQSLKRQRAKVDHPEQTPSGRMLAEMRARRESIHAFAKRLSLTHRKHFLAHPLPAQRVEEFKRMARESLSRQAAIEATDDGDLDTYIKSYYAQHA